jgi:phosphate transport system substrate-binding protein
VAVDDGSGAVAPSLETAKSGDCPLSRPLFTYPAESALANEHVAEFCRYFLEQSTNETIVAERVGYVPNSQEEVESQLEELEAAIPCVSRCEIRRCSNGTVVSGRSRLPRCSVFSMWRAVVGAQ